MTADTMCQHKPQQSALCRIITSVSFAEQKKKLGRTDILGILTRIFTNVRIYSDSIMI